MIQSKIDDFCQEIQKSLPLKIAYKSESTFMKILKVLSFFNPKFSTNTITTVGSTIYFPNREYIKPESTVTITHEARHIYDRGFLFYLKYFFPQWLFVLFIPLLILSWWFLIPLLACLAPIPAYWRGQLELEGFKAEHYGVNEFLKTQGIKLENRKAILLKNSELYSSYISSASYYFAWHWGIKESLQKFAVEVVEEKVSKDGFYQIISSAWAKIS